MAVYVIGGSNSLKSDGWTSRFRAVEPDFVNLSVGATTSITGLYRILTHPGITRGDVLIWEYALNEANRVSNGQSMRTYLAHLEHLLRLARDRGLLVAPLIFTPRHLEKRAQRSRYYDRLFALLAHYALVPFDVSAELRRSLGVPRLPESSFRDKLHYAHDDEMLDFICQGAQRAVRQASVPAPAKPRYVRGERLRLITDFANDSFANSIMQLPVARPPFTFTYPARGEITAITYVSETRPMTFQVGIHGRRERSPISVAASHKSKKNKKPLLRTAVLPLGAARRLSGETGTVGSVRMRLRKGRSHQAAPLHDADAATQIAGIFVTSRAWWHLAGLRNLAARARRRISTRKWTNPARQK
ncbi:hypothetical protein [Sinisalibacter aestuarii]|uniref:SGNH/GDSL hydrolase family protein n=1 Tax=Sinisalibacter aestuarii TaxID=2949426 RepID=A0ABQ5LTU1_9RHOB|nr:hypothetical protein [Sinisalibacter aestuarii]GKY87532.1 hypothetical protein STA1M1_14010 [Sinisalibacter aestuarii]